MWAVVEVSNGYPNWGCEAERVWVFASPEKAQQWADHLRDRSDYEVFMLPVSDAMM